MGMYCNCYVKINDDWEDRCVCDWYGWLSIHDWPPPRKNKHLPFALPAKEGKYLTRYQTDCGDHVTIIQQYKTTPRKVCCGYIGKELLVHWSGNDEQQPYAWRELRKFDYDKFEEV